MKRKKKQYYELDEDSLGLPGPKLTEEQLDKILSKGDGENYEINEAFDMIKANLGFTSAEMKERLKERMRNKTTPHKI
jgi:hypothetical protein